MRKPRDLDGELEALAQRARALRNRRIQQFGELVAATGADSLDTETLAGALLAAAQAPAAERARWRRTGAGFFLPGGGASRADGPAPAEGHGHDPQA